MLVAACRQVVEIARGRVPDATERTAHMRRLKDATRDAALEDPEIADDDELKDSRRGYTLAGSYVAHHRSAHTQQRMHAHCVCCLHAALPFGRESARRGAVGRHLHLTVLSVSSAERPPITMARWYLRFNFDGFSTTE
eukprot:5671915-Pleurochrysis_carterae.AAC.1